MPSILHRLQKHEKEPRRATKRLLKRTRKGLRRAVRVTALVERPVDPERGL
jgi:hypothetical protein